MKQYLKIQENKINLFYNQNKYKYKNSGYSEQQIKGKLREIYCNNNALQSNKYISNQNIKGLGLNIFKK